MTTTELPLWEILVPHRMGKHDLYRQNNLLPKSGAIVPVPYHRVWDQKVREITGGLTICKAAKGQWVDNEGRVDNEIMIPVRIACSEEQITQIAEMTLEYYQQKAILVSLISERTLIFSRENQ